MTAIPSVAAGRYLLGRTTLRWILVPLGVSEVALITYGLRLPGMNPQSTWDLPGAVTILAGPLLAAAAAWLTERDAGVQHELFDSSSHRARRAALSRGWALTIAACGVHVVAVVALLIWMTATGAAGHLEGLDLWLPFAAFGILMANVGVGLLVGAALRSSLSVVVAAVVAFALPVLTVLGGHAVLWQAGGSTGAADRSFRMVVRTEVVGAQFAFGLALLIVGAAVSARRRDRWTAGVGAMGVLGLVVSGGFLWTTSNTRFLADDTPLATACGGTDPVVCVAAGHERHIPWLGAFVVRLNETRRELGAEAMPYGRLEEVSVGQYERGTSVPATGVLWLPANGIITATSVDQFSVVDDAALPPQCHRAGALVPALNRWETDAYLGWLKMALLRGDIGDYPGKADLDALSRSDREAWLQAATKAVDQCLSPPSLP